MLPADASTRLCPPRVYFPLSLFLSLSVPVPSPARFCRFNDLSSIDKLSAVQGKVDAVRGVMQSNINQALKNTEKIEDIDDKAVNLAESANRFKNSSTQLKRSMRCRYIKMIIIMTALVAAILTVIIVPIVISSSK